MFMQFIVFLNICFSDIKKSKYVDILACISSATTKWFPYIKQRELYQ
jgi:hypothetical protein